MLPKSSKQQSQHPNPLGRGARHFNFKSSTVLPKQHAIEEYTDIINNKKHYQSLIKDEIRKLEAMETGIADPEIEPFHIPVDTYKNSNQGNMEDIVENIKIGKSQSHKNKEQKLGKVDPVDVYLDAEIGQKEMNALRKIVNKFNPRKFMRNLKDNRKFSKLMKAASYFSYEHLTRKYFHLLKQKSEINFDDKNQTNIKLLELRKSTLTNNFKLFKQSINSIKLRNRLIAYRKTRQFKVKKQGLKFLVKRQQFIRLVDRLSLLVKRGLFRCFVNIQRNRKGLEQPINKLNTTLKYRGFSKFVTNVSSRRSMRNLSQQLKSIHTTAQNTKQLEKYLKKYSVTPQLQALLQKRFKINSSIDTIQANIMETSKKAFLDILQSKLKTRHLYHQLSDQRKKNNGFLKVFTVLKDLGNFRDRKQRVKQLFLKKYIANFKSNSINDISYRQSLNSCLNGTKQWLMKNKQIFKSEPLKNSSINIKPNQQSSQLLSEFSHPLEHKSLEEILTEQSRFKRVKEKYMKKLFIQSLKYRSNKNKKLNLIKYASTLLHNNHLLRISWDVLKNRQQLHKIMEQIDEQRQIQQDTDVQIKTEQICSMLIYFSKKLFVKRLLENNQHLKRVNRVQQTAFNTISKQVLQKISETSRTKKQNKQISEKLIQFKDFLQKNRINKFISLLKSNKVQGMKRKQIYKQQKERLSDQSQKIKDQISSYLYSNPFSDCMKQVQQKKQKIQFIKLLKSSYKINQGSIQVTSLYLSNKLKKFRQYTEKKLEIKEINSFSQEIQTAKKMSSKKSHLQRFMAFTTSRINLKNSIADGLDKIKEKANIRFMKKLLMFSINSRKNKSDHQNTELVQTYLEINRCRVSLLRLKANRVKRQEKKAEEKKQAQQKQKIKINLADPQKKSKNVNFKTKEDQNTSNVSKQLKAGQQKARQQSPSSKDQFQSLNQSNNQDPQKIAQKQSQPKHTAFIKKNNSPSPQKSDISSSQMSIENNFSSNFQKNKINKINNIKSANQNINSPHISASSIAQHNSQLDHKKSDNASEQESISYEDYRKSLTKWAENGQQQQNKRQHQQSQNQILPFPQKQSQEEQSSLFQEEQKQRQQLSNKYNPNKSSSDKYQYNISGNSKLFPSNRNGHETSRLERLLGHQSYLSDQQNNDNPSQQQDKQHGLSNSMNNGSENKQIGSWASPYIEQNSEHQNSRVSIDDEYFDHRYQSNLLKRYLKIWKLSVKDSSPQTNNQYQKQQDSQRKAETLRKIFLGWQMYSRQKQLVRKYLQEYEQEYNYYPQSRQQYQQFKAITEKV